MKSLISSGAPLYKVWKPPNLLDLLKLIFVPNFIAFIFYDNFIYLYNKSHYLKAGVATRIIHFSSLGTKMCHEQQHVEKH